MANEVHRKLLVALADLNFGSSFANLDSLADGDLAWSSPLTSLEDCDFAEFFSRLKVGTSPTNGGTIEFYAGRGDDGSPEKRVGTDDITTTATGTETTDADIARILGTLGAPLFVIAVDGTTDKIYTASFRMWYPGADCQLFVLNNTGAALNGTGSPHSISVRGWGPEVQ